MSGRPKASTSGQYDGDGRWTSVASPFWTTSSVAAMRTRRPFSSSPYLRCQNSSSSVTVGTVVEVVRRGGRRDHPLEAAGVPRVGPGARPGLAALALRRLRRMFKKKISIDTAMMNAPIVVTMFQKLKP